MNQFMLTEEAIAQFEAGPIWGTIRYTLKERLKQIQLEMMTPLVPVDTRPDGTIKRAVSPSHERLRQLQGEADAVFQFIETPRALRGQMARREEEMKKTREGEN